MARTKASKTEAAPVETKIVAYKAFDKDLKCRGFKYEVGNTYSLDGRVEICGRGFHACLAPFDVWNYYDLIDSRFAVVEMSGDVSKQADTDGDTKIASASITVTAELTMPEFIKKGIAWLIEATKGKEETSGDYAQIGSSGHSAQIGSSGHSAKIGSSGDSAQIGSSGDYAKIGSSGDYAQIGSSGDYAKIGSSGDYAKIGSSGYSAKIEATGANSVVASAGPSSTVKGANGTWVSVAEYVDGKCVGFATGCIGQNDLKENTWYRAANGKLVEV